MFNYVDMLFTLPILLFEQSQVNKGKFDSLICIFYINGPFLYFNFSSYIYLFFK